MRNSFGRGSEKTALTVRSTSSYDDWMRITVVLVGATLLGTILNACGDGSSTNPRAPVTVGFPLYGPGPHWIDQVVTGTVRFDAVADVGVDFNSDDAPDLTVRMTGTTTVIRSNSVPGDPVGDPGHRTHLDLEIVDMRLDAEGIVLLAGDGVGNLASDGSLYSSGTSDEAVDAPELAHDLFEIRFEVEIGGATFHNEHPLSMVATIDLLPPIDNRFEFNGPPLPLFTEAGEPAGIQITHVAFTPLDPSEAPAGAGSGFWGLGSRS